MIVTAKKQTLLPFGAGSGFSPGDGTGYQWLVEAHNHPASVDEACSEKAFLYPSIDMRDSSSFADSPAWQFTTGGS